MEELELKYLKGLAKQYPTIAQASTEIINLQSILNLPKGTEHFVSDIHGEADSFSHVLRNASGVIKNQISAIFGESLRSSEKKSLATLIYYPEQKLEKMTVTEGHIINVNFTVASFNDRRQNRNGRGLTSSIVTD